jgi:hypothetical protein
VSARDERSESLRDERSDVPCKNLTSKRVRGSLLVTISDERSEVRADERSDVPCRALTTRQCARRRRQPGSSRLLVC